MSDERWIEDNALSEKFPFWTRANVGEVLPEPPSPLGWDLMWDDGGTLAGWYDCAVQRLGQADVGLDPVRPEVAGMFGGYAYLCATTIRLFGTRTPGMTPEDIDLAYFGDHPDVPPYVHEPWHDSEEGSAVLAGWLGWVMGTMEQDELEADRVDGRAARAGRPDLTALSDAELMERARSMKPLVRRMFNQHINQSGAASIGPGAIGAVCAALGQPTAALDLVAGLGGVDSAAPVLRHVGPVQTGPVRSSASLVAAFDDGTVGLTERLRAEAGRSGAEDDADAAALVAELDEFLGRVRVAGPQRVGHPRPHLGDRPRPGPGRRRPDAPGRRRPLTLGPENAVREAERERLSAELTEALAADPEAQAQFTAALASAKVFVPGRERSKTTIIRVLHETRMAMWELGRRLVDRGELAEPRDICLLFADEVDAVIAGELTGIRDLVTRRQAHHDWLQTLEPPFIIDGSVPPNTDWPRKGERSVIPAEAGEVLVGNPGCPGLYRGRARVVLEPSDPAALEPGDVLVAPMTDPAWTPLFVPAGAVVVDVGAALSHAIIVSRELGIPCVVSATDATARIPDGAEIEVDGATGKVTILSL